MRLLSATCIATCLAVGLAGCAPIQVKRVDPERVHRYLTRNELSRGELSQSTHNLLFKYHLVQRFDDDRDGALEALHHAVLAGWLDRDEMAALSELAFHHAGRGGGSPYYLAAAAYAWAYLFPDEGAGTTGEFSDRARLAADLYNRGITLGLQVDGEVALRAVELPLPFGTLVVDFDESALLLGERRLERFVPVAEFEVRGFPSYYRWPGIGAPLAAAVARDDHVRDRELLSAGARVPVTALLRFDSMMEDLADGELVARLEVYLGTEERRVEIGGRSVPLEVEPTAALALMLTELKVWNTEYVGFLRGFSLGGDTSNLVSVRPYRPGLIPVVFVHGTASSSARWAELYNELINTPGLRERYQFWFFSYRTGNPVPYSAMLLREALSDAVARLDPEGVDPALRRMVVVGHSQGGLLTKTTVVDSGDAFWRSLSTRPLAALRLAPASEELIRGSYFVEPLPFVERVVFLATPHGGSYVAGSWAAHQLARFIQLPVDLTQAFADVAVGDRQAVAMRHSQTLIPTSVDNMTPGNPFIRVLRSLPIEPHVGSHSIIAVDGDGPLEEEDDGVVEYRSASLPGVDSERVVASGHSCQAHPETVAEMRRILFLHLEAGRSPARSVAREVGPALPFP